MGLKSASTRWRAGLAAAALATLVACGHAPAPRVEPAAAVPAQPEAGTGWRTGMRPVRAARQMVVAADPLAVQAGLAALRAGGSAADAALAVQAVLGLVEPQSSGLGGGAFIVHYDAATGRLQTWDGRETAPAAALPDDLARISAADPRQPQPDARASGRSIGVPGAMRALEALHRAHGHLPWARAFDAAIALADDGFAIPGRMAAAIAADRDRLVRDADAAALFLTADGRPRAAGSRMRNPAYAATLRAIAASGSADPLHAGPIADDIVAEVGRTAAQDTGAALTPGRMTAADLAGYRAVERPPVCGAYRRWIVCGMGPPSSGGIAVAQALGILEGTPMPPYGVDAWHRIVEAERLAFADRDRYVADPDFVPLPARGAASMLDPAYLRARAALIRDDRSLGTAPPGRFDAVARGASAHEGHGTSQVSIVDRWGNAVSMTTTVESSLGAWRVVRGFVLNNELTDFSPRPANDEGPIANRLEGGKRPRSSMAPTLVFERRADGSRGALVAVTGSPGGAAIIGFVVRTLVGLLDWDLDAQAASALPNVIAFNGPPTVIGSEHPDHAQPDALDAALAARGHRVLRMPLTSGVATIRRSTDGQGSGWEGGADPRREGQAAGD